MSESPDQFVSIKKKNLSKNFNYIWQIPGIRLLLGNKIKNWPWILNYYREPNGMHSVTVVITFIAGKSEFQGDGWLGSAMDINEASNITVVCMMSFKVVFTQCDSLICTNSSIFTYTTSTYYNLLFLSYLWKWSRYTYLWKWSCFNAQNLRVDRPLENIKNFYYKLILV